jgi:hypothetical protein
MIRLTKRSTVPRTCGMATVISPSAVWIGLMRLPLREPVAAGVRSYRARPRNAVTSSSTARCKTNRVPRRPSSASCSLSATPWLNRSAIRASRAALGAILCMAYGSSRWLARPTAWSLRPSLFQQRRYATYMLGGAVSPGRTIACSSVVAPQFMNHGWSTTANKAHRATKMSSAETGRTATAIKDETEGIRITIPPPSNLVEAMPRITSCVCKVARPVGQGD